MYRWKVTYERHGREYTLIVQAWDMDSAWYQARRATYNVRKVEQA